MFPFTFIFAFEGGCGSGMAYWANPNVDGEIRVMDLMSLTPFQWNAYLGILCSIVILPTVGATYYQAFKARQEAKQAREGLFSRNCLEFVVADGSCINLIPLETLHTLPRPGDIVLLPGDGIGADVRFTPGAYRVERMEHIYTPADVKKKRPREARLTKAVALVVSLN